MQAETDDQVASTPAPERSDPGRVDDVDFQDPVSRAREEMTLLYVCFGVGISIAFVFLVYVLFDFGRLLP